MFTSNVLNNKRFRQMKRARLWKNVILWAISRREISPLVVNFKKKIDQPSWGTTRRNYKHIPQILCISSRFRVLHLLSWEFERSKVLWRYTVILACHLKHVKVGWSTRNYAHTGQLSLTRTLSWYFLYMSEEFRAFWSKNNQKKKRGKPRLNALKHWESDSKNRN